MKTLLTCSQRFRTVLISILCAFSLVALAIASENHHHPTDTPQHAVPSVPVPSDAQKMMNDHDKHIPTPSKTSDHSMHTEPMDGAKKADTMEGMDHNTHDMHSNHRPKDTAKKIIDEHGKHIPTPPKAGEHSMHMEPMDGAKKADTMEDMDHNNHDMPMPEGGHSMEEHAKMVADQPSPEELVSSVGLDDKTGQTVALDAHFVTEDGKDIEIAKLITGPTIILPIFFYCPVVCPLLLSSLAEGVANIPFKEGIDYRIIALSFNDIETAKVAKNAKDNYLHLLPEDFDKSAWNFLTGSKENILAFTNSIGFRFKQTSPNNFVHPNGLVIVDEKGTIIRYIYGSTFLGADMGMAISEAQTNTPGTSIKRLISICFNYDSEGKEYIALTFKVLATLTIIGLGLFFVLFLRRTGPSSNRSQRHIDKKSAPQDKP